MVKYHKVLISIQIHKAVTLLKFERSIFCILNILGRVKVMSFMLFEILLWGLFLVSILDANKRWGKKNTLIFFLPLFVYGWLLEASAIGIFQRYEYGDGFFVTILGAPLCIAAGWASITYSGMCIGKSLTNNHYKIALFTALWGLGIDFSMDGLAVLMGFWTWFSPAGVVLPYFDVPVSNFIGWFIILSFYSFFHLRWQATKIREKLWGFDAVLPALPTLLLAITIMIESEYERLFITYSWWLMMVIFVVPVVITLTVWLFTRRATLQEATLQKAAIQKETVQKANIQKDILKKDVLIKESRGLEVPLLISHAFHAFFIIMAIVVGVTSLDWRYFIAAIVAGLPLLAYVLFSYVPK